MGMVSPESSRFESSGVLWIWLGDAETMQPLIFISSQRTEPSGQYREQKNAVVVELGRFGVF